MSDQTPERITEVAGAYHDLIMSKPNVIGHDIGHKYVDGVKTDRICIRVFVRGKKKNVAEPDAIPKTIGGVETDVIEVFSDPPSGGTAEAEPGPLVDKNKYNPLVGGISFGPCVYDGVTGYGTLGAIARSTYPVQKFMALTNYHVMCIEGHGCGEEATQPSYADGDNECQDVGDLSAKSYGGEVDCAVVGIEGRGVFPSIVEIGDVAGTAKAAVNMRVRKRGRSGEVNYGSVEKVDGTFGYGLVNQIWIRPTSGSSFGVGGDSGSVVVDEDNRVVGLYCGSFDLRNLDYGNANPIDAVKAALNVQILTRANLPTQTILDSFGSAYGPSLCFGNDNLVLAWTQRAGGYVPPGLNSIWSPDGIYFSQPAEGLGVPSDFAPAVGFLDNEQGNYFVLAFTNLSDGRLYTYTSANATSWLGTWPVLEETSLSAPALVSFLGKLYLAYRDQDNRISVVRSDDGKTWGDKVTLASHFTDDAPALGVLPSPSPDQQDRLFVAWKISRDSSAENQIALTSSTDGQHFGDARKVEEEKTSSRPALCGFSGRLYLAWQGISSYSIYFLSSFDGVEWQDRLKMGETCRGGPSLINFDKIETLALAWTGRDSQGKLNIFR